MTLRGELRAADLAAHAGVRIDPRAPLDAATARRLAELALADVRRRFATATAPDGRRWRPLRFGRASGGRGLPLTDTGALQKSLTARGTATGVVVSTAHPGAALHDRGGVVVPRKGKFLAVPLTRAARRAGSPRKMAGSERVPLFARAGKPGHFLLIRRAVVPRREFMGLSAAALDEMGRAVLAAVADAWKRGP